MKLGTTDKGNMLLTINGVTTEYKFDLGAWAAVGACSEAVALEALAAVMKAHDLTIAATSIRTVRVMRKGECLHVASDTLRAGDMTL